MSSMSARHGVVIDVHALLLSDGRILLGRRQNTGYEDGSWHVPAGHLEPGESVVAALRREAREELSVEVAADAVKLVHVMHRAGAGGGRMAVFFLVREWSGEIRNVEPHKCGSLRWFRVDDLPRNVVPYLRDALEHIALGRAMSLDGWHDALDAEAVAA
jgi:8-oxo-dGTP diphosphatase